MLQSKEVEVLSEREVRELREEVEAVAQHTQKVLSLLHHKKLQVSNFMLYLFKRTHTHENVAQIEFKPETQDYYFQIVDYKMLKEYLQDWDSIRCRDLYNHLLETPFSSVQR